MLEMNPRFARKVQWWLQRDHPVRQDRRLLGMFAATSNITALKLALARGHIAG